MGDWRDNAACRGRMQFFFPPTEPPMRGVSRTGTAYLNWRGERPYQREARESRARIICRGCPVRVACLDFALADEHLIGFWAGTTEHQRDEWRSHRTASLREPDGLFPSDLPAELVPWVPTDAQREAIG